MWQRKLWKKKYSPAAEDYKFCDEKRVVKTDREEKIWLLASK